MKTEFSLQNPMCMFVDFKVYTLLLFFSLACGTLTYGQVFKVGSSDPTASETATDNGSFSIRIDAAFAVPIDVHYAISGTATPNTDYQAVYNPAAAFGVVTFNAGDMDKTINIAAIVDDAFVEGTETVAIKLLPNPLSVYGIDPSSGDAFLNINDNDTAGVTVTSSTASTAEIGTDAILTFNLTSQPASPVTIALVSTDPSEGTVPLSVTINPADWNANTQITVTAADDPILDGNVGYIIQTTGITSADANYSSIPAASVPDITLVNMDNEVPGLIIVESGGITATAESGTTDTFTVALAVAPVGPVTLNLGSSDTGEATVSPAVLTFLPGNFSVAQTVTVTGVDDVLADGQQAYNITIAVDDAVSDDGYDPLPNSVINASNADDDTVGVNVTSISGNTTEAGGTATFTITLGSEPTAAVTIPLNSTITAEGTVPASVLIPAANWNTGVVVTVTGVNDNVVDGNITYIIQTGSVSSSDTNYNNIGAGAVPNITVINEDDDTFTASIIATDPTATEAGTTSGTFTVDLGAQNATGTAVAVNFTRTGSSATAITDYTVTNTVGTTILVPSGAQTATVVINPVDDTVVEGQETVIFNLEPGSPASLYAIGSQASATVTIADNDMFVASITAITPTGTEAGATNNAVFTVDIGSQNNTGVPIIVNFTLTGTATPITDYADIGSSVSILNGQQTNTIIINPVDDLAVEGPETVILSLASGAGYALATPASAATATANIIDNDTAGFTLDTAVLGTTEDGPNETFTVVLTAEPLSSVVISATPSDITEGLVSPATITFTPANYNVPQIITVDPVDDAIVDGDQTYTVILDVVDGSSALAYSTLPNQVVTVTNTDNDTAMLTVEDVSQNEDDASGNIIFNVTLDLEVDGVFTVGYTFSNVTAIGADYTGIPGMLTFTGTAGEVQSITVPIIDDQLLEETETFTVQLGTPNNTAVTLGAGGFATGSINDDDNCAPAPIRNTSIPTLFCDAIAVNLNDYTSTVTPPGTVLTWSTLSDPLSEGAYLLPSEVANPTSPGSYFGFFLDNNGTPADFSDDCASGVMEVELVLNDSPTLIEVTAGESCGPGAITLTAQGSGVALIVWYAAENATTAIFTGPSFLTPVLTSSTTYYVEASENGCTSPRQAVVALIGSTSTVGTVTNGGVCNIAANGPTVIDLDDSLTGADTGVWSVKTDSSNSIVLTADNEVDFAGLASGDYVFTFTTTAFTAPCTGETVDVVITVSDCNVDDDNDGLLTGQEVILGTDPANPDTDGDGILDGVEVGADLVNPLDEDNDGIIDALDSNSDDADNDGVNDQQDPANDNPCIPDNSSLDCPVDLEITKTANTLAALVGDTVTFTITVNNLTAKIVNSVKVGDMLESGFEYVSQTASLGVYDQNSGEWDLVDLPASGSATLDIVVTVVDGANYTNTAQLLESIPLDGNPDNDISATLLIETTSIEGVDLLITKSALPDVALVNDAVVYKITVTNVSENNEVAQGVISQIVIKDTFDANGANFTFLESSLDKGAFDQVTGDWTIPELAINETATLFITIRVLELGELVNTASLVSSSPLDGNITNNSAMATVTVIEKNSASPGFLYNQFSPNGNGQNEILRINLTDPKTGIDVSIVYSITIFDRYGNQVFEIEKTNDGDVWDGTYKGKEAPKGTYFYTMNYSINGGEEIMEKGWIQLIR